MKIIQETLSTILEGKARPQIIGGEFALHNGADPDPAYHAVIQYLLGLLREEQRKAAEAQTLTEKVRREAEERLERQQRFHAEENAALRRESSLSNRLRRFVGLEAK